MFSLRQSDGLTQVSLRFEIAILGNSEPAFRWLRGRIMKNCFVAALLAALVVMGSAQAQAQTRPDPKSQETTGPSDYRSQHFWVHTDLTAAEAKDLLERLEYMLGIIATYWQKQPQGVIEMYVVKDLKKWPPGGIPYDNGLAMIQAGGGLTSTLTLGNLAKSTVYAVADRGTPQHEAVHAYCGQNFGTTGPTWYSEGMAEMGQYWRKNESSVQVHDVVIQYIRQSEPKSLNAIVNGNERTGDSWQNYAWRWALCHLLATNPNYAPQFRPLGLSILNGGGATFESVYGPTADQISFEYLFFLKHLCNGFRSDLAYWDWKRKFTALAPTTTRTVKVMANRGWQPTGVLVKADQEYELTTVGSWKTGKGDLGSTAAGNAATGAGKLVGILFHDYQLTEPFDIGASLKLKAPIDAQLHVRCQDDWSSLGDNVGAIDLKIGMPK